MYPNTVRNKLTVFSPSEGIDRIEVRDVVGRIVDNRVYNGETQITLDLKNRAPSVYFVTVKTETGSIM